jgi:hypothetical protein
VITAAVGSLTGSRRASRPAFAVVVDQHGLAVAAAGQAIQAQGADFLWPPAGVDRDLDSHPDLGRIERGQGLA